jgi:hypothetical protein
MITAEDAESAESRADILGALGGHHPSAPLLTDHDS